jgi:hypothetical protein
MPLVLLFTLSEIRIILVLLLVTHDLALEIRVILIIKLLILTIINVSRGITLILGGLVLITNSVRIVLIEVDHLLTGDTTLIIILIIILAILEIRAGAVELSASLS